MTAGGGVGVLAVLDRSIGLIEYKNGNLSEHQCETRKQEYREQLRQVRDLVAEFIDANEAAEEACAAVRELRHNMSASAVGFVDTLARADAATARRASALAALEGNGHG